MEAPTRLELLRAAFGFKRHPLNLGDGYTAFMDFLSFASSDAESARLLQATYFVATSRTPRNDRRATAEETGEYIDWLIQTQWGEAPTTEQVH